MIPFDYVARLILPRNIFLMTLQGHSLTKITFLNFPLSLSLFLSYSEVRKGNVENSVHVDGIKYILARNGGHKFVHQKKKKK